MLADAVGVLSILSDIGSVITTLAVAWAAFVAVRVARGRSPFVEWSLAGARRRALRAPLEELGIERARFAAGRRDVFTSYTHDLVRGGSTPTVATEMSWLTRSFCADSTEQLGGILALGLDGCREPLHRQLREIARGYESLGRGLQAQSRLTSSALAQTQADLALAVAAFLSAEASFCESPAPIWQELRIALPGPPDDSVGTDLDIRFAPFTGSPAERLAGISVLPVQRRVGVDVAGAKERAEADGVHWTEEDLDAAERECVAGLDMSRRFDGVLPTLVGVTAQRDASSGHRRLQMMVGQITYVAVMARNYPGTRNGVGRTPEQLVRLADEDPHRLLTLSLLPATRDGRWVFVQRSITTGVAQGQIGPAVGGNLELRDRHGLSIDRDPNGFPDPLRALAREAAEEIGVVVDVDRIALLGLGRFTYAHEVATNVLLASAPLDLTVEEIRDGLWRADPVEGAWEVGHHLASVAIPRTAGEAEALALWALHRPGLTPHARLCLLAASAHHLGADSVERIQELARSRTLPEDAAVDHRITPVGAR